MHDATVRRRRSVRCSPPDRRRVAVARPCPPTAPRAQSQSPAAPALPAARHRTVGSSTRAPTAAHSPRAARRGAPVRRSVRCSPPDRRPHARPRDLSACEPGPRRPVFAAGRAGEYTHMASGALTSQHNQAAWHSQQHGRRLCRQLGGRTAGALCRRTRTPLCGCAAASPSSTASTASPAWTARRVSVHRRRSTTKSCERSRRAGVMHERHSVRG